MDPVSEPLGRYREDLEANLRQAEALAPIHCTACNGYHLSRARRRLASASPDSLDRPDMVRLLQGCLAGHGGESFDVLIAGSADTNLLAMCAEAVSDRARVQYTILDHCRTPLALCEAFAREHRLAVQTQQIDMSVPEGEFAANVVVVHSLLRFLPEDVHLASLAALRRWLKPDGAIIFSHRLMAKAKDTESYYQSDYQSVDQLMRLFSAAGLQATSLQEPVEEGGPRRRILVLLKSA